MSELGVYLKSKREEMGMSFDDLYNRTKIRILYLESIEKGDFDVLPGEVYFKGYLRAIARELNVNYQDVIELYEKDINTGVIDDGEEVSSDQKINTAPNQVKNRKTLWVIVTIGVVAAAIGYYFLYYKPLNM